MSVLGTSTRAAGEFGRFSGAALGHLATVWRYTSELLRQASLLLLGSTLGAVFLIFVTGGECTLYGDYFLRSAGASDYVGFVTALCAGRLEIPIIFGYFFSAKVGCGLVAEIGSMRINEEIDAFEAVGVDPMKYVIATRLAGVALFVVIICPILALATSMGMQVTALDQLHIVSKGGFEHAHWGLQGIGDYAFSFVCTFVIAMTTTMVACFYGYRLRGGPVEVGTATSRSMVVNLVAVHVIYAVIILLWFGLTPKLPIGG